MSIGTRSTVLQRRLHIAERIRQQGQVRVDALARECGISTVTIRADLAYLEDQGLAIRTSGGARATGAVRHGARDAQCPLSTPQHRAMAMIAARLARPPMTVLLGPGTLPALLPPYLPPAPDLNIVVTSLDALPAARQHGGGQVHLLGGQCHPDRPDIDGPAAIRALALHDIDLFVLETAWIARTGLALHANASLPLHQAAARAARATASLLDAGRHGASTPPCAVLLQATDFLITADRPDTPSPLLLADLGFAPAPPSGDPARLYARSRARSDDAARPPSTRKDTQDVGAPVT
ncbi:DeoR family transcriptional regulator [Nguyenibacter sp. L1]|uniref:DeoR family transcriptional regulator n=1 Tax=Nguyenibacter sp. L1 TaxID=3049350 RepID=UPI002B491DDD|nr:DeoR family transcriptional regulator [Nguyenibacter sp. L1]WRH87057.1 DeoR family transcriptional regulator [Nguyenibacter sp. L1]